MNSSSSLERRLGLFSTTNLVIANMVGAGIFTTSGLLMADLHSPILMLVLWILGGVIALTGALCYGEIGAAFPQAGGEYAFLSKLYHPLVGFLSGWVSFLVGFSAPIAASSIGLSEYLFRAYPHLLESSPLDLETTKKGISILIITLFTGIHLRGVQVGASIQNYLTIIKVIIIVSFILFGLSLGTGDWSHITQRQHVQPEVINFKTIGLSLMWIMFAYSGWNASTYIGSEIKNPEKNIPRSLILGTGIVTLLYFLVNLVILFALTPTEMEGVISIGGLAMQQLFGDQAEKWFSLMISIALFSSISAFIMLGPRVYYAMANEGHFFRFASKVHPTTRVPVYSILFQGAIAIVIILTGTLDQILTYMGFSLSIFPLLAVASIFKIRKNKLSTITLPGFPYTAGIYLITGILILILSLLERPVESTIAIATVLVGVPSYFAFERANRRSKAQRKIMN